MELTWVNCTVNKGKTKLFGEKVMHILKKSKKKSFAFPKVDLQI